MEKSLQSQKSVYAPLLINKDDLFKLIDIREPYFALKQIFVDDKSFSTAQVPIEQSLGSEIMPISSAEASRHMAILGAVSCAYANPEKRKHYYLAHSGSFKRISQDVNFPKTAYLTGNAICTSIDKRKAVALTQLSDPKGNPICEAEVFYHVIPDVIFERLYKPHFIKNPDYKSGNPYKTKNELFNIRLSTTNLTASLGKLPEHYCAGHFPNYPALPVAILLYNLLDLAGLFIYHTTRDYRLKFMVKDFTLTADNLAFAGDKVDIEIKHMHSFDNLFVLSCRAIANGDKMVGEIQVTIEGIK